MTVATPATAVPPSAELPAAVLWDMDGTLVDTEPYWFRAEQEMISQYGSEWTAEDGLALVGQGLRHSAAVLRERGVDLSLDQIVDELTRRVLAQADQALPWRPGALELLHAAHGAGIPNALVTMSMRPLAERIATAFEYPLFEVIVTGGDVDHPKPHPEAYQRAARMLEVDISSCVAIEDSLPGLTSARTAGAVALGVPAHVELPQHPAHTLWPSLAGRTVDDLAELYRSRRPHRGEDVA